VTTAPARQLAAAAVGLAKQYGGVRALAGVDLEIEPGRVHAVVGGNGAGKSTLMKILAGAEQPEAGRILIRGEEHRFADVTDARRAGVSIVFQELSLFPHLDVLANIAAFSVPPGLLGRLDRGAMTRIARPIMDELGLDVPLDAPVRSLALNERQLVEIARALVDGASVLILDEPNSALNLTESERLFAVIDRLRANGTAILYVSHRLEEVVRIADTITVIRDGQVVDTFEGASTTVSRLIVGILGHRLEARPLDVPTAAGGTARTARAGAVDASVGLYHVTVPGRLADIDLEAHPGEVVGLAGLEGAGQKAVIDLLFGRLAAESGEVRVRGLDRAPRNPREAVARGIAYVPADRRLDGVMLEQSIGMNVAEVEIGALAKTGPWATSRAIDQRGMTWMQRLGIVADSPRQRVGRLSGGNQQKAVLAKWLAIEPVVVLLDDPLRGVDVGAKDEIKQIVRELAAAGRTVLFRSSELLDYFGVCDRVVVFWSGRIVGERAMADVDEHRLLEAINTGIVA
jgi:ABC-type sugar transport system ATPase subunit